MSRRHAWLGFTAGGPPLAHGLDPAAAAPDLRGWQRDLHDLQQRWYAGAAPPRVASAFVLQWLLQVPAQTAAQAAASGPWRARLTDLTYRRNDSHVPDRVRLTALEPDAAPLADRLDRAERDYRAVAAPLAATYPSAVRLGPHTRSAMVTDMWAEARRGAESASGVLRAGAPARISCCLIYALPGCTECAGCPRRRPAG